MPVFPDVDSTTVVPRSTSPLSSASWIILAAGRSFALPPGLGASSFAQTSMSGRGRKRRSATSGVLPIAPRTPSTGARGLSAPMAATSEGKLILWASSARGLRQRGLGGALVPVRPGLRRHRVADVVDGLGELGDDVVRAVLVAGHDEARDAAEGDRDAVVVRLGEHSVHALEHALDDARRLPQPGRGGEDEDLRGEQLLVHGRPVVALALVGRDAGEEVEIDRADHLARRADALERVGEDAGERLRAGGRRGWL